MSEKNLTQAEVLKPTASDRFFFENNGYLVLENFLSESHVGELREALFQVMTQRREKKEKEIPHTGMTDIKGEKSTRIFYILDDDPLFLEMLDWSPMMAYVKELLNEMPHHHASDAIIEYETDLTDRAMGWHIDGHDSGYRGLGAPIPFLQLKIGYYLNDMTSPGQGNLCIVPASHKTTHEPPQDDLQRPDLFPGAVQICAPAGTAILFHNALWHSAGPFTQTGGFRLMLYYAYEHPWMIASQEHWGYSKGFYNNRLSPEQRKLFHGFLFDPPEQRWG